MTGTGEVLHRGTKVFWKVRSTCDVVLIKHLSFDLVEVVCYDPVRSREAARLYVKQSVVQDRISEKQFVLTQRIAAEHKEQPEGPGSVSSGTEVSGVETVNYICDRLHVQSYDPKSRVFQIELVEYLPTEEKPAESEPMVHRKPSSLIPFDIMLVPSKVPSSHPVHKVDSSTGSHQSKDLKERKEHKDLTLDIPAVEAVEGNKSHTPKTPKTPVPAIQLSLIRQDEEEDGNESNDYEGNTTTAPNTTSTNYNNNTSQHTINTNNTINPNNTTNNTAHIVEATTLPPSAQAQIALAQTLARPVTAHTADSIEADFHIHHGRRSQNHQPFSNTKHNTHTNNTNTDSTAHTSTGSSLTSPVVSPRPQAGTAYAKQITPRKGGHISVLQATHNTHNSHAAEARHAKQHIHTNHSIVSHYSVGSSHLAPIPVPDQLTKVTTHPTLPPHRNLTPHQEPYVPPNGQPRYGKKKPSNTISGSIASFTNAMYSLFGSSNDVRVAVDNTHADEIQILNSHNVVQHVKPGTIANYAHASSNSINSSSSAGSGIASIPKHMRTDPLHS